MKFPNSTQRKVTKMLEFDKIGSSLCHIEVTEFSMETLKLSSEICNSPVIIGKTHARGLVAQKNLMESTPIAVKSVYSEKFALSSKLKTWVLSGLPIQRSPVCSEPVDERLESKEKKTVIPG